MTKPKIVLLSLFFVSILVAPWWQQDAQAQVNTSGVRGTVVMDDGDIPFFGAQVVLVHTPTGNRKEAITNEAGEFAFTGLRVGGPYQVNAYQEGFVARGQVVSLAAGKNERIVFRMKIAQAVEAEGQVIEIEGNAIAPATSNRTVFSAEDINNSPTLGRDPKDMVRTDPEAVVDGNALSIGGINNRFNSITIDGIRQNDSFGLKANGYPTNRSPIALNTVAEISVERTPFDVRYGQFLGGNVNIVTKTGTNEFHGDMLFNYASSALLGTEAGDETYDGLDFKDYRYGFNLGGPLIKDKLHFFASVEGLSARSPRSIGAESSGAANEKVGMSIADVERIRNITRDVYGFDAGTASESADELDLKLLAKVDWAIDNKHRLAAIYQRTGGDSVRTNSGRSNELPLTSSWYNQKEILHSFSLRLFSDWSEKLSTQLDVSGKIVKARSNPLSGNGFMSAEIATQTMDGNGETTDGLVIVGPDPFRHANRLDNNLYHTKAEASYLADSHLVTGGLEVDVLDIFNLFVPSSNGEAEFASIDDFEARMPSSLFYSNAITNNVNDGAADWGYQVYSLYLQDQYWLTEDLTVQGGLRFEIFNAKDDILLNQNFKDRYGFDNTTTISGKNILLPRIGLTYKATSNINVRGGFGLYSGGTPNVWLSNSYTNNGVNTDSAFSNDPGTISGFNGRNLPAGLTNELVAGDGNVDALDPDFKIPSSWKLATGVDYKGQNILGQAAVSFNYVYSRVHNGLKWQDLRRDYAGPGFENNTPVGRTVDGRPYYDNDATDDNVFDTRRGFDMLLTNTGLGRGHTASLSLKQSLPHGFSLFGAYSYQNVTELSPATSSRSVSNYGQSAVSNPNNPKAARSNYERRHRFIGTVQYADTLVAKVLGQENGYWKDAQTVLSVFAETRSGQPFSYTFGGDRDDLGRLFGESREFSRRNRQLFYVPDGSGDDVIFDGIDEATFDKFLESSGLDKYRGKIAPRNAFTSDWLSQLDLRFAQDIPTISGQKFRVFMDIQNLGNLLNSDWGLVNQAGFPYNSAVVAVDVDPATGKYIYRSNDDSIQRTQVLRSLWRIQINAMYSF